MKLATRLGNRTGPLERNAQQQVVLRCPTPTPHPQPIIEYQVIPNLGRRQHCTHLGITAILSVIRCYLCDLVRYQLERRHASYS